MAADDLPEKFDVIVLGTGFLECVLAAAFARVGYSVLHIDRNDYYCGNWAAFNLQGVDRWVKEQQGNHHDPLKRPESPKLQDGDVLVECPLHSSTNFNINTDFLVKHEEREERGENTCDQSVSMGATNTDYDSHSCSSKESCPSVKDIQETKSDTLEEAEGTDALGCSGDTRRPSGNQSKSENDTSESLSDNKNSVEFQKPVENEEYTCSEKNNSDVSKTENVKEGECKLGELGAKEETGSSDTNCDKLKHWTQTAIEKEWRKFNIDLAPKLLYCRGEMVELLIHSDVSKYCEFKTVSRVLTLLNNTLQQVPCSRADVFSSKSVSMIEKRMMMKFLMFCMDFKKHPEEYTDYTEKPFKEFLDSRKLKPNIRHFIQHSIAMATDKTTTLEGLEKTQKFILSLGRYGNTAFLWPLYGSGELPQSFARLCAVFAGIYCLRMTASSIIVDKDNKYRGIITTEGHRVESRWLIGGTSYLPSQYLQTEKSTRVISRAVLMTNKSIQCSESEELTLVNLPSPDDPNRPVAVLELSPSSMASPQGMYLVHLTREGSGDCKPKDDLQYAVDALLTTEGSGDCKPKDDLQNAVDALLITDQTDSRPSVLWYMYFNQTNTTGIRLSEDCPGGITVIPGPGTDLDMDNIVTQAKEIFERILPDEEFLPKAPNPEDIIYDDGQNTQTGDGFNQMQTDEDSPGEKTVEENSPTEQHLYHKSLDKEDGQGDFPNTSTGSVEEKSANVTPLNCSSSETEEQL